MSVKHPLDHHLHRLRSWKKCSHAQAHICMGAQTVCPWWTAWLSSNPSVGPVWSPVLFGGGQWVRPEEKFYRDQTDTTLLSLIFIFLRVRSSGMYCRMLVRLLLHGNGLRLLHCLHLPQQLMVNCIVCRFRWTRSTDREVHLTWPVCSSMGIHASTLSNLEALRILRNRRRKHKIPPPLRNKTEIILKSYGHQ